MARRLFKRECSVTVARPLTDLNVVDLPPNATVIENLRVTFRIEKHLGKEPNTAEVCVYNLSELSRGEMQRVPLYVRVDAGYDGQLQRLFTGDLRPGSGRSLRRGVDWETTLELGDGERAYRFARVSRSYRGGVTARTAVTEIAKSMGVVATFTSDTAQLLRAQYASGLTLQGAAHRELSRILAPHGLDWSIQDGRLQVIKSQEVRPDQALVVSQDAGMIGVPEFGAPEKKGAAPLLTVRMLLNPQITPGGRISLESETVRGIFRVERVQHVGDTHGDDWFTEAQVKAQTLARVATWQRA
jgi:hypothetical protein